MQAARALARTPRQADLYELNLRTQVLPPAPRLHRHLLGCERVFRLPLSFDWRACIALCAMVCPAAPWKACVEPNCR